MAADLMAQTALETENRKKCSGKQIVNDPFFIIKLYSQERVAMLRQVQFRDKLPLKSPFSGGYKEFIYNVNLVYPIFFYFKKILKVQKST